MVPDDSSRLRSTCVTLARRQHGVVARHQLLGDGIPGGTIDAALRREFLFKVIRGTYSVGRQELSEFGIWMACVLAAGPGAALADTTAAIAWGFRDRPITPVRLSRPGRNTLRLEASFKAQGHDSKVRLEARSSAWLLPDHLTTVRGVPIVRVEPVLLQLAGRLNDERFQYAFWEADRTRGLNESRLAECAELSRGLKGAARFRRAVDSRLPHIEDARSLLEVLLHDLCRRETIPQPVMNRNLEGHLVDFRWPHHGVVVEADGYEYHRGRGSFERDTRTNNDLRAAGWTVLRFTYRMIRYQPEYVKETIIKALANASQRGGWQQ